MAGSEQRRAAIECSKKLKPTLPVGGGLAGLFVAMGVVEHGARVVVLEKAWVNFNGKQLKPLQAQEVRRLGCEVLDFVSATKLFLRDGRIACVRHA